MRAAPGQAGPLDRSQTHTAATDYEHAFARSNTRRAHHGTDPGRHRAAQQCGEVEWQRRVHRHDRFGRHQRLFCQRPRTHRRPHRTLGAFGVRFAERMLEAHWGTSANHRADSPGGSARDIPGEHDVVAGANGRHVGAHLGDDPRALVTQRAGQQGRHEAVAHRQVGVAHAAGRQLHRDLVAGDRP